MTGVTEGRVKKGGAENVVLWVIQALLAALFLFAGISKLVMPLAAIAQQTHLSVGFLRFIGVAESLGGLGLILPWLLNIGRGLTPLAAWGLVVIMVGAVVVTVEYEGVSRAPVPFTVGLLLIYVALRRWANRRNG